MSEMWEGAVVDTGMQKRLTVESREAGYTTAHKKIKNPFQAGGLLSDEEKWNSVKTISEQSGVSTQAECFHAYTQFFHIFLCSFDKCSVRPSTDQKEWHYSQFQE